MTGGENSGGGIVNCCGLHKRACPAARKKMIRQSPPNHAGSGINTVYTATSEPHAWYKAGHSEMIKLSAPRSHPLSNPLSHPLSPRADQLV